MTIEQNLFSVRQRIAAACARAGRRPDSVTLVAVTKMVGPEEIAELYRLGVRDFGENRVQDGLLHKDRLGAADSRWHLIGHLQRNKAAAALQGGFVRIHSVESEKLLRVLDDECARFGQRADILLEVNIAGEESKYGLTPEALPETAAMAASLTNIAVSGLMTMAPLTHDPEASRPHFRRLRELRDATAAAIGRDMPELSMGMTGDFEVAVEEGATLVRVGTALFCDVL